MTPDRRLETPDEVLIGGDHGVIGVDQEVIGGVADVIGGARGVMRLELRAKSSLLWMWSNKAGGVSLAPPAAMTHRFAFLTIAPLVVLFAACSPVESAAKTRAANEFSCPEDQVIVTNHSGSTVDVQACGQAARYTCPRQGRGFGNNVCVREPIEP